MTAQAEGGAALSPGGNLQATFAKEGGHINRAAECGEGKLNRYLAEEVIVVALEQLVLLNVDDDV